MKRDTTFRVVDFGVEVPQRPRATSWVGYAIGALLSLVAWSILAGALFRHFGVV